jgi:putative flippase GtrA
MRLPQPLDALGRLLLQAWHDRAVLLKMISFGLIGCVNASIDFGVFSLGYFYLGLPIVAANVISWCVAVTNSYVMNSKITFAAESGGRLRLKDYAGFAASQTGGLAANTITVIVASYFIPVLFAKVLAIGASFVVDFSLSHFVVFRRRTPTAEH